MRLSLSLGLGGVTPATAAARHDRGPRHAAKPRLRLGQLPDAHGFPRLTLCRPPAARAFPLPRLKRKITPPPPPPPHGAHLHQDDADSPISQFKSYAISIALLAMVLLSAGAPAS